MTELAQWMTEAGPYWALVLVLMAGGTSLWRQLLAERKEYREDLKQALSALDDISKTLVVIGERLKR